MLISIHKNFLRFNLLMGRVNVIHPNILECSFVLQKIQVLHSCSALLCSIKAFVLGNETLHMLHLRLVSTWKMKLKSFHPIQLELILRIMTMTLLRTMMFFFVTLNIIISYIVLTIFVIYILLCFILKKLCFSFYSLCPALLCLMKALGLTNETLHMLQ